MNKKKIVFLIGILLTFTILFGMKSFTDKDKSNPNVILLTLEATRAGHLSCYGYHRNTTPNICELAKDGILFENAYSNSANTATSIPTILTSKYPYKFAVYNHSHKLNVENILFDTLKANGYEISVFSRALSEEMSWIDFNVTRKFDPFKLNKLAMKSLTNDEDPDFVWIHYGRNHFPYTPLEKHESIYTDKDGVNMSTVDKIKKLATGFGADERITNKLKRKRNISREIHYIKNLYDESVKSSDYVFKDFLEKIKSHNMYNNSLIIVSSDHGECLGEHNIYFTHQELYDKSLHVPLIIKMPQNLFKNKRITKQVRLIDLFKTISDLANLEKIKKDKNFDGVSLKGLMEGKDVSIPPLIARHVFSFGVRTSGFKYILHTRNFLHNGSLHEELYNLKEDPEEKHNLMKNISELHLDNILKYKKIILGNKSKWTDPTVKKVRDEKFRKQLKKLGYIK